jgi:hypothetical protein
MNDPIVEFAEELIQTVHVRASESGMFFEDAFFDVVSEYLIDAGEIDEAERAYYDSGRGIRVDGYGGDPRDTDRKLTLIAVDAVPEGTPSNLTQTEMDKTFRRLERFIDAARRRAIQEDLDPSIPAWALADLIAARWSEIETVRLIVLTNRPLSSRIDRKEADAIDNVPVTYGVWDLTRLQRYVESGSEREKLEVDFRAEFGGSVPALAANIEDAGYQAYLAVIPGSHLAKVYDRWGARLLEQNVRVFLQARSKVNKGIRATLENEQHMFLAYNNGITATAEAVEVERGPGGLEITRVKNLQIVNGGQTTASIHRASKTRDLSQVFVQMKLAVLNPDDVDDIVPLISEFANSQNRVSQADFFSNHPFHIRLEELSRRIYAPSVDGEFVQTRWFYERAKGQYLDASAYMTPAQKREFKKVHPPQQKFTKTDLAKFLNVWRGLPHVVSLGAQKNFANFAEFVASAWGDKTDARSGGQFDERFYKHSVAKAIVFRATERIVSAAEWYDGGYRANIVAYSIAKLDSEYQTAGRVPDFDKIWETQRIPAALERTLYRIGREISSILSSPPTGIANVTEWAKKPGCWERVRTLDMPGLELSANTISKAKEAANMATAKKDFRVVQGIEAQIFVVNAGGAFWTAVRDWARERKLLSEKEIGILAVCTGIDGGRIPSEKQSAVALEALLRLTHEEGCPLGRDLLRNSPFG